MLPIQAILNHPCSYVRPESPSSQPSASESPSPTSETADTLQLVPEQPGVLRRTKKARDSSDLSYMRPQGPIKYPPFEKLDAIALNLMRPFNIYPFGEIAQYCAHIPYSSDKKDVYKKTGRESFNGMCTPSSNERDRSPDVNCFQYLFIDSPIRPMGRLTTSCGITSEDSSALVPFSRVESTKRSVLTRSVRSKDKSTDGLLTLNRLARPRCWMLTRDCGTLPFT